MRLVTDAEVRAAADPAEAAAAIAAAFAEAGAGATALQPRARIVAGPLKFSTMAAILPGAGVAGAKVYTTLGGAFRFVVLLFDAGTGAPLACMEADAFTGIRTAAATECVAAAFARPGAARLAVFGTGVQAQAHVRALARRFALTQVALVSRGDAGAVAARLAAETGVEVRPCGAQAAVEGADIVVTATRSRTPVLEAGWVAPHAFVAAVGATLPETRELPSALYARAGRVLVEDRGQSFAEAGDLILAEAEGVPLRDRVETLAEALAAPGGGSAGPVVFKSVGIALEDVAVAAAVWRRLTAS